MKQVYQKRVHLIKRREQLKLSQAVVGKRAGMIQNDISKIELGQRRITPEKAMKLAAALECTPGMGALA